MENKKFISQIAATEEAQVDRVSTHQKRGENIVQLVSPSREVRKKTIRIAGSADARVTKIRMQEAFDNMREHFPFEYGEHLSFNIKNNEIEIYSRWIDGNTLNEGNFHENHLKPFEVSKIKNKLKVWVRIFEYLSFYHINGILHGNLKPQNILFCDRTSSDIKKLNASQFFDKREDLPAIVFLDGGYAHFIENEKQISENSLTNLENIRKRNFWLAPEAHGFIEGSYLENSDVFSLAAIMAWDFGLIKQEGENVISQIGPLFQTQEANHFVLGHKTYTWSSRNPISDILKRLSHLLTTWLEPVPEKRMPTALECASEIMLLTQRLADVPENSVSETDVSEISDIELHSIRESILSKGFSLPSKIVQFILNESPLTETRFWIDARSDIANKSELMRKISMSSLAVCKKTFYFRIKTNELKDPFYNLNHFFSYFISHILFFNPNGLHDLKSSFSISEIKIDSILFILPALRLLFGEELPQTQTSQDNLSQLKHESLIGEVSNILNRMIQISQTACIMIDDINRADDASLSILLDAIANESAQIKWILGICSMEEISDEKQQKIIARMRAKDPYFSNLKEDKGFAYWTKKLNKLETHEARILAIWAISFPLLELNLTENISGHVHSIEGIFTDHFHDGKSIQKKNDTNQNDWISNPEKNSKTEPFQEKNKLGKDGAHIAHQVFKKALQLGLISENRNILNGRLICYDWKHHFVLFSLSFLLNEKIKSQLYCMRTEQFTLEKNDEFSLERVISFSHYLRCSKLPHCAYAAYAALTLATQKLGDSYSTRFIIKNLRLLEESVERDLPKHASCLIPKIREKIADLSRIIGDFDVADKYYEAISWNSFDETGLALISMKRFFPETIKKREQRKEEFLKIIRRGIAFFPVFKRSESQRLATAIESIIAKVQKKLSEKKYASDNDDTMNTQEAFKNLTRVPFMQEGAEQNKEAFVPVIKNENDLVVSQFLRANIGWVDNAVLFPHIVRALQWSTENGISESIIHLLLSLLLTSDRGLNSKTRNLVLETASELASKARNALVLPEIHLMRAWFAFFFDGNLPECKRSIDRVLISFQELTPVLRLCAYKIQLLCEFESLPLRWIQDEAFLKTKYLKRMSDMGLENWRVGHLILHLKTVTAGLDAISGDESSSAHILSEKTDQILLLSHYLFDTDNTNGIDLVRQEAKNRNIRAWLRDPSANLDYFPEKIAEKTGFDKAKTHDTDTLYTLVQSAARAGFLWTAARLAQKAKMDLSSIQVQEDPMAQAPNVIAFRPKRASDFEPRGQGEENHTQAPAWGAGVSINYILEFLHNFYQKAEASDLNEHEIELLIELVQSSIPLETNLIESTLAESLRSSTKRLELKRLPDRTLPHPEPLEKELDEKLEQWRKAG